MAESQRREERRRSFGDDLLPAVSSSTSPQKPVRNDERTVTEGDKLLAKLKQYVPGQDYGSIDRKEIEEGSPSNAVELDKKITLVKTKVSSTKQSLEDRVSKLMEKEKNDFRQYDNQFRLKKLDFYERSMEQKSRNDRLKSKNGNPAYDDSYDDDSLLGSEPFGSDSEDDDLNLKFPNRRVSEPMHFPGSSVVTSSSTESGKASSSSSPAKMLPRRRSWTSGRNGHRDQFAEKAVKKQLEVRSDPALGSGKERDAEEVKQELLARKKFWSGGMAAFPSKDVPKVIKSPDGTQIGVLLGLHD